MKTVKKIVKTVLAIVCFTAIILAGGENPDGSCNLVWSLSWIAVAYISGRHYMKLDKSGSYDE